MEKEFKVEVPDGYEIDKENSTFECIKFKPIKKELPKTWEEYCKNHPIKGGEYIITIRPVIVPTTERSRDWSCDKNILPNKEYAEAILALCLLIKLRDCYNDGWIPDWTDNHNPKYSIEINENKITKFKYRGTSRILAFKTQELCDQFLKNFRDLIEVAKPLL